jgi:TetR/AcrR family transcriptional repressor of nem operon
MRVSREQAAANRERIIEAAAALFRAKGFDGVGVADIMKAVDLTHGGFYGHFDSKDDLIAQACSRSMRDAADKWEHRAATAPDHAFATLVEGYLSERHRDDPGGGCVFAALANDVARSGRTVRSTYADGLRPLIDILTEAAPGPDVKARRQKAIATLAGMIGALMLARAVKDTALADEVLQAATAELEGHPAQ